MSGQDVIQRSATHAFLWSAASGMVDLGLLPSYLNSSANSINDLSQVVGTAGDHLHSTVFMWTSATGMLNLNTMMDFSGAGWTLTEVNGVNNKGQIVGAATDTHGNLHAFLLTPVPEPSTLVLATLALGAVGALARRNRRAVGTPR